MLKLFVTIDDWLKQGQMLLATKHLLRDRRGEPPQLSAAAVLTILGWGAWRGLRDKAQLDYSLREYHQGDFPRLGSYSKFVEASNRYCLALRGLLALVVAQNRNRSTEAQNLEVSTRSIREKLSIRDAFGRVSGSPHLNRT